MIKLTWKLRDETKIGRFDSRSYCKNCGEPDRTEKYKLHEVSKF